MMPGKHQRSKGKCQDLCLKVRDPSQSFVLRSYTMHELCNQHVSTGSSVRIKQLLCYVQGQGQKREQKHTTKSVVGFHNHSPLLTMYDLISLSIIYFNFLKLSSF